MSKRDINDGVYDEKTQLKLTLFKDCFAEWIPVFFNNKFIESLYIMDLFSGSGGDKNNNLGSPLLLLNVLSKDYSYCKNSTKLKLWFNDISAEKIESLKCRVKETITKCECSLPCPLYSQMKFTSFDFLEIIKSKHFETILNNKKFGKFILIDQYGIKFFTAKIFKKLMNSQSTDFICFYSSSTILRFAKQGSIRKYLEIEKIDVKNTEPKKIHRAIAKYYQSLIPEDKEYYLHHFSYLKGSNYYGLLFGTSHSYGMEKYLKVCWDYDPLSGESTQNINNDFGPNSLFYKKDSTIKKDKVKQEIKKMILSGKLVNNIEGLKYTLKRGCRGYVYRDAVKDLLKINKISIVGNYNQRTTKVHQMGEKEKYEIKINK